MKYFALTFIFVVLNLSTLRAAEPDPVANQLGPEWNWSRLSAEQDGLVTELIKRQKLVEDKRLTETLRANGRTAIALQKNKQMANSGLAQDWPETTIIEERTLPSGGTVRYWRAPTEGERVNEKLLHGMPAERMGAAFKVAGMSVAIFAGVIDQQIENRQILHMSGLGGTNHSSDALLEKVSTKGACADMAEGMNEENYDYTYFVSGIDKNSGKFSMSTFLFSPACFFTMFGEYLTEIKDDADNDCPSGGLECILYRYGPEGRPDDSELEYAGTFGPYEDPSAIISIPLDNSQAIALNSVGAGGGMPFSLLAGSASVLASAAVGATSQLELEDGSVVVFDRLERAIDLDAYVTTLDRICGNREFEGESQEFCISREYSNFKTVPGTLLYEPYQETLRISGMFSDAERAEMAEAEEKMAEYETQLAAMPASQRSMMERMVGPQMAQYKNMVEGGRMSFHIVTTDIIVDPDFANSGPSLVSAVEQIDEERLVRRIQQDLETLGYEPGALNGEVTPQTVTAIVRFEGDQGMKVTGAPSQSLADALALAVSSRSIN